MYEQEPMIILLREAKVSQATGKSRSVIWAEVKEGLFTPPVKINSGRAVGWPQHEVNAINRARVASKSDEEIRALVTALIAERTA